MSIDLDNIVGKYIETNNGSKGIVKQAEKDKSFGAMIWFFRFQDGCMVWASPEDIKTISDKIKTPTIKQRVFKAGQLV